MCAVLVKIFKLINFSTQGYLEAINHNYFPGDKPRLLFIYEKIGGHFGFVGKI